MDALPVVNSETSVNYTLSVENEYNLSPTTCNFKVTYGDAMSRTLVYGVYQSFVAGNTYSLKMAGGSTFRCTYELQTSAVTIGTFNNSTFGAAANQNQATATNPGSGTIVTFIVSDDISGSLECTTDW